jgi:hypothetical protein
MDKTFNDARANFENFESGYKIADNVELKTNCRYLLDSRSNFNSWNKLNFD